MPTIGGLTGVRNGPSVGELLLGKRLGQDLGIAGAAARAFAATGVRNGPSVGELLLGKRLGQDLGIAGAAARAFAATGARNGPSVGELLLGKRLGQDLGIAGAAARAFAATGVRLFSGYEELQAAMSSTRNGTALTGRAELWTPQQPMPVEPSLALGQLWAEYVSDLGLWVVRPGVKAVGIPTLIFLFSAWYLSFSMEHPEVAAELKEVLFGVFFLVMGGWWSAGKKQD